MLTNTVGAIEAWAFSSTLEDVALRTRLYAAIGTYAARKLLAQQFPLGTAIATVEHMRTTAAEGAEGSVIEQLANQLLSDYAKQQRKEGRGPQ